MTLSIQRLCFFLLAALLLAGCGKKESASAPPVDQTAFEASPPEIKQIWDAAQAASANNDPAGAINLLRMLSRSPISQEQQKTVFGAIVVNENKLRDKAKAGDAEAAKAMETYGVPAEPRQ